MSSPILGFLLLLRLAWMVNGKLSVFLLGDSTSVLLYIEGLMPVFNCTIPNLQDGRQWEALNHFRVRHFFLFLFVSVDGTILTLCVFYIV